MLEIRLLTIHSEIHLGFVLCILTLGGIPAIQSKHS